MRAAYIVSEKDLFWEPVMAHPAPIRKTTKRAGLGSPPPPPYWKGFDIEEDQELAGELFYGTTASPGAHGSKTEYLKPDSPRERSACQALARLLSYYVRDPNGFEIIAPLCAALMDCSSANRRIVFKRRKGRPKAADIAVALFVVRREDEGLQNKNAISDAMNRFKLSRSAVFKAIKRTKLRRY
jgi:hypothetical protein